LIISDICSLLVEYIDLYCELIVDLTTDMITHRHCSIHSLPIDIVCRHHENCIAVCQHCFAERSYESNGLTGVKLNSESLNLFTSFNTFVQTKMQEWINSVHRAGADAVFEKKNISTRNTMSMDEWNKMRDLAVEALEGYRGLIKTNNEYVSTNTNSELFYHP
jgi:hypothetical protein